MHTKTIINNIKIINPIYTYYIIHNLIKIAYHFISFYKVIYFTKAVFEQLPIFNAYTWPYSIIRIICSPYAKIWTKLFPKIKINNTLLDVSFFIGYAVLNKLEHFLKMLKIMF